MRKYEGHENAVAFRDGDEKTTFFIGVMISAYLARRKIRKSAFAAMVGMNPSVLSHKLLGQREWKAGELRRACDLLGITADDRAKMLGG